MDKVAKFQTKLTMLEARIVNFESPSEDVSTLIKEGISSINVRAYIKRIKEMAQKPISRKDDLHSISSGINNFDAEELETRFRKVAIDEVNKARVIVPQFLKDSTPASTAATAKAVRTGGGASHSSNIKMEAFQLPKFSGDERGGQAFLKYPI